MAYFAKLDHNNIVLEVHSVNNNELLDNGVESEDKGIAFLTEWSGGYTQWKQTSYNRRIRKNYASIGYSYDPIRDAFIPPKLFASWVLDEDLYIWIAPIPYPTDEKVYTWDEPSLSWTLLAI